MRRLTKKAIGLIFGLGLVLLSTACTNSEEQWNEVIEELQNDNASLIEQLSTSTDEVDKNQEEINLLNRELEASNEEFLKLESEVATLKNELKTFDSIDEESLTIINFLNDYNGRILTSDMQPTNEIAILNSAVGIRIFPDSEAPIFGGNEITNEPWPINGAMVMVHGYYNGYKEDGWAYVSGRYSTSGYVNIFELESYEYKKNYQPVEQFRDFKIGMNSEDIFEYFDNVVDLIKDRNSFGHVIRVNNPEDSGQRDIDFWYHIGDRRISVINTNSEKYPLESGFKVGDQAVDVFAYYDELYEKSEYFNSDMYRRYDIGDGYTLDFRIQDGIVVFIMINGGMYAYA